MSRERRFGGSKPDPPYEDPFTTDPPYEGASFGGSKPDPPYEEASRAGRVQIHAVNRLPVDVVQADGHHRHKKQTGGAGQFGEVYLRVMPIIGDEEGVEGGLLFVDDTFGGSVPRQYLPAIEKGVRRVMNEGAFAGYPMHNIRVEVYDGKHHPVDSKEVAFITAGRKAFIDAIHKAKPVLLEPYVKLEITVPADMIGDISADLSGKRGRILGTDMLPFNQAVVTAEAPLAEMITYSSQLKSMTAGAGSYAMEYSHDERTPPNVQQAVISAFKPHEDED